MQPCFTPAKRVKASVNLLLILTADLSVADLGEPPSPPYSGERRRND